MWEWVKTRWHHFWFIIRIGRRPVILFWIAVLGLITLFFGGSIIGWLEDYFPVFGWRILVIIGLILLIVILVEGSYRVHRKQKKEICELKEQRELLKKENAKDNIEKVVNELTKIGIYSDKPVNITRILYHDREKLAVGLSEYEASDQDRRVLTQLNLSKIVQLEQRRRISGQVQGGYDEGFWVLTNLGKEVILYLGKNPQVLGKAGSLA